MGQRRKRQTRIDSRKTSDKTSFSEENRQNGNTTEPINQEHKEIIRWFQKVKFRRAIFGGIDENDVWKKLQELNQLYEAAIRAERERYDILLTDHERTYSALIYKYKQEMMKNDDKVKKPTGEEVSSEVRNEVRR